MIADFLRCVVPRFSAGYVHAPAGQRENGSSSAASPLEEYLPVASAGDTERHLLALPRQRRPLIFICLFCPGTVCRSFSPHPFTPSILPYNQCSRPVASRPPVHMPFPPKHLETFMQAGTKACCGCIPEGLSHCPANVRLKSTASVGSDFD